MKKQQPATRKVEHGKLGEITVTFDVPGSTLLAVHNALSYTLDHRDQYLSEADDCEHCIKAMDVVRRYLSHVVENIPAYEIKKKYN